MSYDLKDSEAMKALVGGYKVATDEALYTYIHLKNDVLVDQDGDPSDFEAGGCWKIYRDNENFDELDDKIKDLAEDHRRLKEACRNQFDSFSEQISRLQKFQENSLNRGGL